MAKLFAGAYVKCVSGQNAVNGFKKPGIWPFNPHVFGKEDYAPSPMTDRPLNEAQSSLDAAPATTDCPSNDALSSATSCPLNPMPTTTGHDISLIMMINFSENEKSKTALSDSILPKEPIGLTDGISSPAPSANLIPMQIRPIPAMAASKTNRKRKRQKSEILTSTPVKAKQAIKYEKLNKKKTKISELAKPSKNKKTVICKNKKLNQISFVFGVC